MGTWKDHIESLRREFTGRKVYYEGKIYNIVTVDYNGIIHIDKPTKYNASSAVYEAYEARKVLVEGSEN